MHRLEVRLRPPEGAEPLEPTRIQEPRDVYLACRDLITADREHFLVLHLDAGNRILAKETVSIGSLTRSLLTCREVFKGALLNNAAAVILVHNHPSGDPTPSKEDLEVTCRLEEAGNLLGVPVLDHLVIGAEGYRSLSGGQ